MTTTSERATILIVEDDPGIAELERERLSEAGHEVLVAGTADEAITHLRGGRVDLILLDYRLPGAENGLDFYARVKASGFDVPVILVTGFGNETTVIQALRAGVRDFVTKSVEYLDYLPDAVNRVLRQEQIEQRLAESEARLASVIASAKDAIIVAESDRRISLFNAAAERMFQCPAAEALGQPITRFIPDEPVPSDGGADGSLTLRMRTGTHGVRADGEEFPLEASVSRAQVAGRKVYTIVVRDVTERLRAEAALRESEERFRAFMNNSSLLAWMKDEYGRYAYLNRSYQQWFGVRLEDWLGKTDFDVWPPEIAGPLRINDEVVLLEDRPVEIAEVTPNPAGGQTYWWSCKFPFRDAAGRRYVGGIGIDITARVRAEERVQEQAALLDMAHDAIKVTDLDGRLRYWNRGAERVYGWTAAEVVGRETTSLLYQGHLDEQRESLRRVREEGEWIGEQQQVTKDGKEIITQGSWSLVRDHAGKPTGVLMICTDVTEKKRLEAQFRRAQRLESLGSLAGGIAHDLNNVLTPIAMAIDFLDMPLPDGQRQAILATLRASVERGAGMVRQVLSFARGVEGQRAPVRLRDVVLELEKMVRQAFPKSIEVRVELPPDLWAVVGDATQLYQVVMNLCVNARDAMPRGGRLTVGAGNVYLEGAAAGRPAAAKPGPYVRLWVADTGTGIPADVLAKIFDPFFTTKAPGAGTGLGLATFLGIVKSHGGFVDVQSEVGRGSCFSAYLPAAESAAGAVQLAAPPPPAGHGELILVVDDEDSIRQIASATLEANGYRVLSAGDGLAAVALFEKHREEVRAVVCDRMMPMMDGPATVRAIRALAPQVPVIMASGMGGDSQYDSGPESATQAVLKKPYTRAELLAALASVIGSPRPEPPGHPTPPDRSPVEGVLGERR